MNCFSTSSTASGPPSPQGEGIKERRKFMKKTLSLVLSLIMIITALAATPFAAHANTAEGETANFRWELSGTNLYVFGKKSGTGVVDTLPWSAYENEITDIALYDVKKIGDYEFARMTKLEYVYLYYGIEEIGTEAFDGCSSLIKVQTASTIKKIGDRCFYGCVKLDSCQLNHGLGV